MSIRERIAKSLRKIANRISKPEVPKPAIPKTEVPKPTIPKPEIPKPEVSNPERKQKVKEQVQAIKANIRNQQQKELETKNKILDVIEKYKTDKYMDFSREDLEALYNDVMTKYQNKEPLSSVQQDMLARILYEYKIVKTHEDYYEEYYSNYNVGDLTAREATQALDEVLNNPNIEQPGDEFLSW